MQVHMGVFQSAETTFTVPNGGLLIFSVVSFYWTTQVLAYLVRMAAGAYFTSAYLASSPSHPQWNPPQSFKSALGRAASTSFGTVAFASLLSGSKHLSSNLLSHAARILDVPHAAIRTGRHSTKPNSARLPPSFNRKGSACLSPHPGVSTKRALSDTAATDAMMAVGTKLTCAAGCGAACATFAVAPRCWAFLFGNCTVTWEQRCCWRLWRLGPFL
ncbi:hypothetical protein BCR44DRAFT_1028019 [Catenaria anguillulae PL171]|uniref:Protein PNS1 n=1 Tax=Catenaria anguillulae PL171 TaxID=765915 RepID=A0A1Y2HTF0_9FUNG|nr:hypothetical protein BCR44DRAFT_1028019 [Catenaria anguillulae PL171]